MTTALKQAVKLVRSLILVRFAIVAALLFGVASPLMLSGVAAADGETYTRGNTSTSSVVLVQNGYIAQATQLVGAPDLNLNYTYRAVVSIKYQLLTTCTMNFELAVAKTNPTVGLLKVSPSSLTDKCEAAVSGSPLKGLAVQYFNNKQVTIANGSVVPAPPGSTAPTTEERPNCEASGFSLGWVLCPISDLLAFVSDWLLDTFIIPFLRPTPIGLDPSDPISGKTYQVWSAFRTYGNIILVIALIVAVLSQAFGGGLVEAYTARKMLPRILTSAILINVSIYIVAFAVDISRVAGDGLQNLITAPLSSTGNFVLAIGGAEGNAIGGAIIAIIAGAYAAGVLGTYLPVLLVFVLLPAALAVVGIFITAIFLQALVIGLGIAAPVAFALYCLPNTEKYFHTWWDWFYRALLVFPIIMSIIGVTKLMTSVIQQANTAAGGVNAVLGIVIAFFVQFLPLLAIPFSFKAAGGIVGKLSQLLGGQAGKLSQFIKGNPNDPFSMQNKAKRAAIEGMTRRQSNLIAAGRLNNKDGTFGRGNSGRRRAWSRGRGRFASWVGMNVQERMSGYNEQASKRMEQLSGHWDDALIYAGGGYKLKAGEANYDGQTYDSDKYFNSRGDEISAGLFAEGQGHYGKTISALGQTFNYTLRKAQNDNHRKAFEFALGKNAQARKWGQTEMDAVYPAAAYPHKGRYMSQWYSKPEVQSDGSVKWKGVEDDHDAYDLMTKDVHRNLQQYMQSGQHDVVARVMSKRQQEFEAKLQADQADKAAGGSGTYATDAERQKDIDSLGRTYELFDNISSEYATGGFGGAAPGEAAATVLPGGAVKTTASGTTAAAKPIIEEAVRARVFKFKEEGGYDAATGRREMVVRGMPGGADGPTVGHAVTGDAGYDNLQRT